MSEVTNRQRALWAALMILLVTPFLAGLAVAGALIAAPVVGAAARADAFGEPVGVTILRAYVWSAAPSALAVAGLTPMVLRRGTFGVVEAGAAGLVGFAAAHALFPWPTSALATGATPVAACVFGLLLIVVRRIMAGRIILP